MKIKAIQYFPLYILQITVIVCIVFGSFSDILSLYKHVLFVRGKTPENLMFYLTTSAYISIHPFFKKKYITLDVFYVLLCAFYMFQIEYAGLSTFMLENFEGFSGYRDVMHINYYSIFMMIFFFSVLLVNSGLERTPLILVFLVTIILAVTATYHSYWSWLGLINELPVNTQLPTPSAI